MSKAVLLCVVLLALAALAPAEAKRCSFNGKNYRCPHKGGVCCPGSATCCPHGYSCVAGAAPQCKKSPSPTGTLSLSTTSQMVSASSAGSAAPQLSSSSLPVSSVHAESSVPALLSNSAAGSVGTVGSSSLFGSSHHESSLHGSSHHESSLHGSSHHGSSHHGSSHHASSGLPVASSVAASSGGHQQSAFSQPISQSLQPAQPPVMVQQAAPAPPQPAKTNDNNIILSNGNKITTLKFN